MGKKRILLVDYEPKLLERLESMLPVDLYEVATARDGFAALEEFDRFHPDLVFLRTMLPKKHGFQVCQEIVERSGSRPIPVVMHCSIYKSRKYRNDAIKVYGAAEYLEDPIEDEALKEVLTRLLDRPQPAAPPPAARGSIPEIKLPPPSPSSPGRPKTSLDLDKALEDTLSGLGVATRKSKAPSVESTIPVGDLPKVEPPPAPAPPAPPPAPPAPPKPSPEDSGITSEELFGDVIEEVAEAPKAPPPAPAPPPQAPAPSEAKAAPAPAERPIIDVDKVLGGAILPGPIKVDDTGVKRLRSRAEQDLSKKLEETLGGVKLAPKAASPAPSAAKPAPPPPPPPQPPAPPEEPKAAAPPPPPPKPEPPKPEPPAAPKEEPKPAAKEPKPAEKEKGVVFGNYLLLDKIATGGMAELFKARLKGLEGFSRIVAIKRILPHLAANKDFVTMFIDEAKLAAQLTHPNIGHIYDLGKLEESYFIAMEYVEGRDLRAILKELEENKRTMPVRVATYIAQKVCEALQYAHTAKDSDGKLMELVHRDVSPQNVIISTHGEVKLVDFGIAKAASKASHTQTGALKGKLLYMSPEQAWGKTIDRRTDIFSLGAVMCEMLTGQKLFYGDSEMSILEKVREAKITPPRQLRPDIPEELETVILKALEKDPGDRYQDCRAVQADLERFAYDEWETLPSAYDAAAFLSEIFPDVYRKEILATLKRAPERGSDRGDEEKGDAPSRGRSPKSQRGKQAPSRKERDQKAEPAAPPPPPSPPPKPEPKAAEPPAPPPPPKPAPPPPPPAAEETTGSRMFGDVVEGGKSAGGNKKLLVIGGAAAAVVLLVVVLAVVLGGKKSPAPEAAPAQTPPAASSPAQPPAQPQPKPEAPPVIETPKPAETAPSAAPVSEAELQKERSAAQNAMAAFTKGIGELEQAGGATYAGDSLAALKKSEQNIGSLLRRAKTKEEYQAVARAAQQGVGQIPAVKTQVDQAKAAEQAAAQKKAEEDAAAKKAQEDAAKKAADEQAKKQAEASSSKIKAGDFVELWAVDVKPRELQKVPVQYTPLARQNRVQGTVWVEVQVDETGRVTNAKIAKGLSPDWGLNQECIKAALQTRYSPAIKEGVPVKTTLTYPVVFKISS